MYTAQCTLHSVQFTPWRSYDGTNDTIYPNEMGVKVKVIQLN